MRGFLDMKCDARTDGRTHKRESIGLSAEAERPITRIFLDTTLPFDDSKQLSQVSDKF